MSLTAKQKRGVTITVVTIVVFMLVVLGLLVRRISMPTILSDGALRANGAFVYETPRIIKEFDLVDHHGKAFTKENLKGKWTLAFFGFTFCPDVCPTTMAELKNLYEELQGTEVADDTQVILFSVDPARDTPEKLAEYVPYFHPEFIGVTGEFMNIYRLATNVNIAFNKVALGGSEDPNNYTVDHSANIVLINDHGDYQGFFKPPFELAKLKMTYRSIRATH